MVLYEHTNSGSVICGFGINVCFSNSYPLFDSIRGMPCNQIWMDELNNNYEMKLSKYI